MKFEQQVVLVTGGSRGLGKAFAHFLADAGATAAINSTGRDARGQTTVDEIIQSGGQAAHFSIRVEHASALVDAVLTQFGRLDGIVHNAGFLQDKTLRKMSEAQWDAVLNVHLKSAFLLSQAAWPHFEHSGGGRLVFISSASGLYGNFGQSNYAAAKAGMHGLARSIALEGAQSNICCNVVAPFGATEMNSATMPEARKAVIKTDFVAPLVGYLAHPECAETGGLFEASAGVYKKVRWQRAVGLEVDITQPIKLDDIANGWQQIVDFSEPEYPTDMRESLALMYQRRLDTL